MSQSRAVPELKEFHVSPRTGFLLEFPKTDLPEYFQTWMEIGKNVGSLLSSHKLRDMVNQMPLLDAGRLRSHKEKRLANLLLSLMTSGYIWQDGDIGMAKVVPRQLAVPMCQVAEDLGLPYIGVHAALCSANWKLVDEKGPLELSNLETISVFPGGSHCSWFFLVTAQVELHAVPGILASVAAQQAVVDEDESQLMSSLTGLAGSIRCMKATINRMFENLPPDQFYNVFRPYLSGWGGENSPAPDGVIFEGVSEKPFKAIGGSAAQSPPLQCFDAVLGIQHTPERQKFLDLMRTYMLPAHRQFIEALRNGPSVRQFVLRSRSAALLEAYDTCVSTLEDFRSFHIKLTTRYIVIPSNKKKVNDYEAVAKQGTGGTEIIPFLKCIRDTTKAHRVDV